LADNRRAERGQTTNKEHDMRIKDARRARMEPSSRGFRTLGRFTLQPTEGILIFDCRLIQAPDGRMLVYGPSSKADAQVVSMSAEIRNEVVTMAQEALGIEANEFSSAA
jgi:hypothetical protein